MSLEKIPDRSQRTPFITYRTSTTHIPHLRSFSVCVFGWVNKHIGALGRASPAIALLSQIKPPKSHPTPNKMLMEPMANDYSPGSSENVQQISVIIDENRRGC